MLALSLKLNTKQQPKESHSRNNKCGIACERSVRTPNLSSQTCDRHVQNSRDVRMPNLAKKVEETVSFAH